MTIKKIKSNNQEQKIVGMKEEKICSRGRIFEGIVKKKFHKRVVIEFERTVYVRKFERFYKKKTKLHARLPDAMASEINVGDYIKIEECRPLSKIIHFVVIEKVKDADIKGDKK